MSYHSHRKGCRTGQFILTATGNDPSLLEDIQHCLETAAETELVPEGTGTPGLQNFPRG